MEIVWSHMVEEWRVWTGPELDPVCTKEPLKPLSRTTWPSVCPTQMMVPCRMEQSHPKEQKTHRQCRGFETGLGRLLGYFSKSWSTNYLFISLGSHPQNCLGVPRWTTTNILPSPDLKDTAMWHAEGNGALSQKSGNKSLENLKM